VDAFNYVYQLFFISDISRFQGGFGLGIVIVRGTLRILNRQAMCKNKSDKNSLGI